MKPFDLARWVRKLLLLLPIFLSTRYSLTSSNFTASRLASLACPGLDLFLTRGAIGAWNISVQGVLDSLGISAFVSVFLLLRTT